MADHSDPAPLIPPQPITDHSEIDLEAGPSEQIQCRICLETDGNFSSISISRVRANCFSILIWRLKCFQFYAELHAFS